MQKYAFPVLFYLFSLLCACNTETVQVGTVATVNGTPISIDDLKKRYDSQMMHLQNETSFEDINVEEAYASVLLDMIVEELIEQELNKKNIPIDNAEVEKLITELKQDYTEEDFESMLADRYIEYDFWKKEVRSRYMETLFIEKVVQPQIKLNQKDIETFYNTHKKLFDEPEQIKAILISSEDKKQVEKIIELLKQGATLQAISKKFPRVYIEKNLFEMDFFSKSMQNFIRSVKKNQITPIQEGEDGMYMAVSVIEIFDPEPKKLQDIHNEVTIEAKNQKSIELYQEILASIINSAKISIAPQFEKALELLQSDYSKHIKK